MLLLLLQLQQLLHLLLPLQLLLLLLLKLLLQGSNLRFHLPILVPSLPPYLLSSSLHVCFIASNARRRPRTSTTPNAPAIQSVVNKTLAWSKTNYKWGGGGRATTIAATTSTYNKPRQIKATGLARRRVRNSEFPVWVGVARGKGKGGKGAGEGGCPHFIRKIPLIICYTTSARRNNSPFTTSTIFFP